MLSNHFNSWLTPMDARMNARALISLPNHCQRHLSWLNVSSRIPSKIMLLAPPIHQVCNDFCICESDCIAASISFYLLCYDAWGWLVGKGDQDMDPRPGAMHRINSAPWHGSAELQQAMEGSIKLTPIHPSWQNHDPLMIGTSCSTLPSRPD